MLDVVCSSSRRILRHVCYVSCSLDFITHYSLESSVSLLLRRCMLLMTPTSSVCSLLWSMDLVIAVWSSFAVLYRTYDATTLKRSNPNDLTAHFCQWSDLAKLLITPAKNCWEVLYFIAVISDDTQTLISQMAERRWPEIWEVWFWLSETDLYVISPGRFSGVRGSNWIKFGEDIASLTVLTAVVLAVMRSIHKPLRGRWEPRLNKKKERKKLYYIIYYINMSTLWPTLLHRVRKKSIRRYAVRTTSILHRLPFTKHLARTTVVNMSVYDRPALCRTIVIAGHFIDCYRRYLAQFWNVCGSNANSVKNWNQIWHFPSEWAKCQSEKKSSFIYDQSLLYIWWVASSRPLRTEVE